MDSKWRGYHIQYNRLKDQLHLIVHANPNSTDGHLFSQQLNDFLKRLDFEIGRAATCYQNELADVKHNLEAIRASWRYLCPETFPAVYMSCKELVQTLQEILIFMETNATSVRNLLKVADEVSSEDRKALDHQALLKERLRPDNLSSAFKDLRIHKGTKDVIIELKQRIDALRLIESVWIERGMISLEFTRAMHSRRDTESLVTNLYAVAHQTARSTKWYYRLLLEAEVDYESQPLGESTASGIFLNNLNTFLYMANYYLVIPTAPQYAEAVGLPPRIASGFLLAMTPLSSLFASVLYSVWSNRNFKTPLLFCTLVLIMGNLLYGLAYDCKKAYMLYIGRLLVGIGGNRAVNRRYVSDFVPLADRTFHSAVFVTVGSLGMSLGPGIQPLVNRMPNLMIFNKIHLNFLTTPPLGMVIIWIVFALQTIVWFQEPKRRDTLSVQRSDLLTPLLRAEEEPVPLTAPLWSSSLLRQSTNAILPAADPPNPSPYMSLCTVSPNIPARNPPPGKGKAASQFPDGSRGAFICLGAYFCLKFVQEAFQTAAPLVTSHRFGWTDSGDVGMLLAVIGIIVLPSNILIGWLGNSVPDRWSQLASLIALTLSSIMTLDTSWYTLSLDRYIAGALCLFISAQALESVNMSLLSKLMPKSLSQGLWNSGFLSTEFGTFGRVCGAAFVSLVALVVPSGRPSLQNVLTVTYSVIVSATLVISCLRWDSLIPITERSVLLDNVNPLDSLDTNCPVLRPLCISPTTSRGGYSVRSTSNPLGRIASRMNVFSFHTKRSPRIVDTSSDLGEDLLDMDEATFIPFRPPSPQ